jgi:polyhydroxyalkanoate synthesis regulator phasin
MSPNYYANFQKCIAKDLPEYARLDLTLGLDACPWLDEYIKFSRQWSPRAYDLYHTACGLFVLSTVAARRVTVPFGKYRYPNLTILLVGRTGMWTKSTTAQIAKELIEECGLGFLLLPKCTPEKMISLMSLKLPEGYDGFSITSQNEFKKNVAFIGQRGWYFDEAGMLFNAMRRSDSPMAGFHSVLRILDDNENTYQSATIGRGLDNVQFPYLAFLGCTTPSDLQQIAYPGSPYWSDGFFARYLFAVPPEVDPPMGRFPEGERQIPNSLILPIKEWHERLGMSTVEIKEYAPTVELAQTVLSCSQEVIESYYQYFDGLRVLIKSNSLNDLDGNYTRFPEVALRISILFASLGNCPVITLSHWTKAVAITEEFRKSLHNLYVQIGKLKNQNKSKSTKEKVVDTLVKKGNLTVREISQQTGLYVKDIESALNELKDESVVEKIPEGKTFRFRLKQ